MDDAEKARIDATISELTENLNVWLDNIERKNGFGSYEGRAIRELSSIVHLLARRQGVDFS